jgi:hypothetical protein
MLDIARKDGTLATRGNRPTLANQHQSADINDPDICTLPHIGLTLSESAEAAAIFQIPEEQF